MSTACVVVSLGPDGGFACDATTLRSQDGSPAGSREHTVRLDEPGSVGGADTGPTPVETALIALASCKAMTCKMYAERKGWPLGRVGVTAHLGEKVDGADAIAVELEFVPRAGEPAFSDEQLARLKEIAGRCPVSRMMAGETRVDSSLVRGG